MPVGYAAMAEHVHTAVRRTNPHTILDIGMGYGLWGALIRNYFGANASGSIYPTNGLVLHGVEIFPVYRNPMWDLYNQVLIGDIQKYTHIIDQYDLVVFIDVIEHLPKELGELILTKAKHAIVGVCQEMYDFKVQPYGNTHEDHTTVWDEDQVKMLGYETARLNPLYFAAWK